MNTFWRGKQVLVTGGSGFIGSSLTERLVELGASVSITSLSGDLKKVDHLLKDITVRQGDLQDSEFAEQIVQKCEIVFHLAALKKNITFHAAHPADVLRANSTIAINMMEAIRRAKVEKTIIISSNLVSYGELTNTSSPHYGYAWSKYYTEALASAYTRQYSLPITIVRPQNVFGPRDNFDPNEAQVIPSLIAKVAVSEGSVKVLGTGQESRAFIYVKDVVDSLIELADSRQTSAIVNIIGSRQITIQELVEQIQKLSGKHSQGVHFTGKQTPQINNIADDKSPATIVVDDHFIEGLSDTLKWYQTTTKGHRH